MQLTMTIKEEKLLQFQDLVKSYDFRFIRNPQLFKGLANVAVDGDHLPMEKCNEFMIAWERLNTQIVEVESKNFLEKIVKKMKKNF